jgi:DNA-binding Xre family transcriptional regulator
MARLPRMRLRVSEILGERGMTAYGLHKASDGALSLSACYRLAADTWDQIPRETLTALCDTLKVQPGDLFAYRAK